MGTTSFDAPTILVPVDFDEPSRWAVGRAEELAHALGGRLVILHVVPPTSFPEGTRVLPVGKTDPIDLSEYVSAHARRLLDEHFKDVLIHGIEVRAEARSGHPVETILLAIAECDAKLVVMGTHARTGVAGALFGSVAAEVVRRATVPVMAVQAPKVTHQDTPYVGAAMVTGAVAGAATGVIAGPAGAIAGGAIGTVVGIIAGSVMGRERTRADEHDRELDDAIGVTSGTIGTPQENKRPSREVEGEGFSPE